MTVAELRALLETLPERFDDTEVMVYGSPGLYHIAYLDLDRRRMNPDRLHVFNRDFWDGVPKQALERKLRIEHSDKLWHQPAPDWWLRGWWPKEAAEIGLPGAVE